MVDSKPLVLYHAQCNDGFCAAWCAWLKFGDRADYIPVQYGTPPPDVCGRHVFILDFSYKRDILLEISLQTNSITVLDHHVTAQKDLDGLEDDMLSLFVHFDMNKSGGRLSWERFYPGRTVPWLVDYTEDRDLWIWKLPESRAINACIASYPHDFTLWSSWHEHCKPDDFVEQGNAILRYQQQVIDSLCSYASEIDLAGYKVLCVNTSVLISEVAGKLAENRPFGACWFQKSDGAKVWSLRSRADGEDVAEIARQHGGGGHVHAAGWTEKNSHGP